MVAKASLFQTLIKDGQVLLRVTQNEMGEKASLDAIQANLHEMDVDYVPETLLEIYEKASGKYQVLCDEVSTEYQLFVEVSNEEQSAYLTIIPPTEPEFALTVEQIIKTLHDENIYEGIKLDTIEWMIENNVEHEPTLIAEGELPENGKNGFMELLFNQEFMTQDELLHVDIREMNLLQNVEAEQPLIAFYPPTAGVDGYTVTGRILDSIPGIKCRLFPGRNTRYNDDRSQIISNKNGYVCLTPSAIAVEDLYEVEAVDGATGNIHFNGILKVLGDIEDAFVVEASVRIEVGGSIGKAKVASHGDIRVSQGILGARIKAGGSVRASFISDSTIEAQDHIIVNEYILNSNVSAGKILSITKKNGFIAGGQGHAGNFIKIPNIGSQKTEASTTLEVGIAIKERKSFNNLEERMGHDFTNYEKLKKNLLILQKAREKRSTLPEEHEELFEKMTKAAGKTGKTLMHDIREWRQIKETIRRDHECDGGIVFIEGHTHVGTVVKVRRVRYNVNTALSNAAYMFTKEGVKVLPYEEIFQRYKHYFYYLE